MACHSSAFHPYVRPAAFSTSQLSEEPRAYGHVHHSWKTVQNKMQRIDQIRRDLVIAGKAFDKMQTQYNDLYHGAAATKLFLKNIKEEETEALYVYSAALSDVEIARNNVIVMRGVCLTANALWDKHINGQSKEKSKEVQKARSDLAQAEKDHAREITLSVSLLNMVNARQARCKKYDAMNKQIRKKLQKVSHELQKMQAYISTTQSKFDVLIKDASSLTQKAEKYSLRVIKRQLFAAK